MLVILCLDFDIIMNLFNKSMPQPIASSRVPSYIPKSSKEQSKTTGKIVINIPKEKIVMLAGILKCRLG